MDPQASLSISRKISDTIGIYDWYRLCSKVLTVRRNILNDVNQRRASSWKTMCVEIERERPGDSKARAFVEKCDFESSASPTALSPISLAWMTTRKHRCYECSTSGSKRRSRGPSTLTGTAIRFGTWPPTRHHSPIGSSRSPNASTNISFVATPNARRLSINCHWLRQISFDYKIYDQRGRYTCPRC